MILLYCGSQSSNHFESLLLFAQLLDRLGHDVAIDDRMMPEDCTRSARYEASPFLAEIDDIAAESVIVIAAERMSNEVLELLQSVALEETAPVFLFGQFDDLQAEISARNSVAYAMGREPTVLQARCLDEPPLKERSFVPLISRISDEVQQSRAGKVRVLIFLPYEELEDCPDVMSHISGLRYSSGLDLAVLSNSKFKDHLSKSFHSDLSVFGYSELPPTDMLGYFDILVFFGADIPGERMASLCLLAAGAGKIVVDCTTTSAFAKTGAPVLKGPFDLAGLSGYLSGTVIPNRFEIGARTQGSDWLKRFDATEFEQEVGLSAQPQADAAGTGRIVFMPTNGNGLGHAQRCCLVAEELPEDLPVQFAAFPSCVDVIRGRGFACVPLVSRSPAHTEEYASDLVNGLRLRRSLGRHDTLVFDGGYVFDSVYREISRQTLSAVWIRRGLWQAGHVNAATLERERAFSRVIVPVEAFDELNADYSFGDKVFKVGPIVQKKNLSKRAITALRKKLGVAFDRQVDTLVVTMLGGGVASERTAQTQQLCSLLEDRPNCLHLVLAWPNAFVPGALHGWQNSHVVHSAQAIDLCQGADVCVSAAGYNSYHELLYSGVPTIFIPQSAPYMDDQERRAQAASERGLARFVPESDMLALSRELSAFLDEGRADDCRQALSAIRLPEKGNAEAARLIEEVSRA